MSDWESWLPASRPDTFRDVDSGRYTSTLRDATYLSALSAQMDAALEFHARRVRALFLGDVDFPQRYAYMVESDPGDISGPRAPWDYGGAAADDDEDWE